MLNLAYVMNIIAKGKFPWLCNNNLGFDMFYATSDDMECGMMYRLEK
jgi:hypothetical protein